MLMSSNKEKQKIVRTESESREICLHLTAKCVKYSRVYSHVCGDLFTNIVVNENNFYEAKCA